MVDQFSQRADGADLMSAAIEHDQAGVCPAVASLIDEHAIGRAGKYSAPRELVVLDLPGYRIWFACEFPSPLIKRLAHQHLVAQEQQLTGDVLDVGTGVDQKFRVLRIQRGHIN